MTLSKRMDMTIKIIKETLKSSKHPVGRALYKTASAKTLAIGFGKGMKLNDHKTNVPTKFLVVQGEVEYHEGDQIHVLSIFDEYDIPVGIIHSVIAHEESVILLLQDSSSE